VIGEDLKDSIKAGRISLELLDVAVLDLLHEGLALEEIGGEIGDEPPRNSEKRIVDNGLYLIHMSIFYWYDDPVRSHWTNLQPTDGKSYLTLIRFVVAEEIATGLAFLSRRFLRKSCSARRTDSRAEHGYKTKTACRTDFELASG